MPGGFSPPEQEGNRGPRRAERCGAYGPDHWAACHLLG